MNRIVKTAGEIKQIMDSLREAGTYFMAGSNSIWIPSTQTKVLDVAACKEWPDLNGELLQMTPGEAARTELSREFPDHKRVGWFKGHITLFDFRPPLYCDPVGTGKFVSLDLTGAYHQIYQYLWLDTPYPMGYGNKPLFDVGQRLQGWKSARNALIGVCRGRGAIAYKGSRRIELKTQNSWLSPGLWATVQQVLNEIATRAIDYGAVYVNTDGYIFPQQSPGWDLFENWLEKHGFNWSVKAQGRGEIAGWGCYKVGSKSTHLYDIGSRPYGKIIAVSRSSEDRFTTYLERCRERYLRDGRRMGQELRHTDNPGPGDVGPNIDNSRTGKPEQPSLFEYV